MTGGDDTIGSIQKVRPRPRELAIVHEDETVRITASGNPDDPNVFLCFTGVGGGVGGIQVEEFVGSTRLPGYFALYVTDKQRRWFNWDPAAALSALRPYVAGKSIVTIGNSMGGFGAIWITAELGSVKTCVAFAAQYSVHPEIVPKEPRWMQYRRDIATWRTPSLLASFSPSTRFWTFNGEEDIEHWSRFPQGDHLTHLLIRDAGHDVAQRLKEVGVLADVIRDCCVGIDPSPRIAAAGVVMERIDPASASREVALGQGCRGGHFGEAQRSAVPAGERPRLAGEHARGQPQRRANTERAATARRVTPEARLRRAERQARRDARKRDDD